MDIIQQIDMELDDDVNDPNALQEVIIDRGRPINPVPVQQLDNPENNGDAPIGARRPINPVPVQQLDNPENNGDAPIVAENDGNNEEPENNFRRRGTRAGRQKRNYRWRPYDRKEHSRLASILSELANVNQPSFQYQHRAGGRGISYPRAGGRGGGGQAARGRGAGGQAARGRGAQEDAGQRVSARQNEVV